MAAKKKTKLPAGASPGSVDAREYFEKKHGPLTFARMLRSIRLCDEVSLATFAAKLGISRTALWDIEQDRKGVSPERAARWARLLGYSEAQFVRLAMQRELDAAGLKYRVGIEAA